MRDILKTIKILQFKYMTIVMVVHPAILVIEIDSTRLTLYTTKRFIFGS